MLWKYQLPFARDEIEDDREGNGTQEGPSVCEG